MTRNNSVEPNLLAHRPYRDTWPPTCPLGCGFVGEPNDAQSPWIACWGDPTRHQRTPVGGAT